MNIILIGVRCTGKTAAGRRLAALLGWPFRDTDEQVVRQTGRTISRIVAEQGWQAFREAEAAVIRELADADCHIIALGGGAVLDVRNVVNLKRNGLFVWLFAAAETIAARMESDAASRTSRPSLTGEPVISEVQTIMAEREPLYRRLADLAVDTTGIGADRVAEAIRTGLGERLPQAEKTLRGKEK